MARGKPDAIIILGGGVGRGDVPVYYTKERLEAFLLRKKRFAGTPVITSGAASAWLRRPPKYTEAGVMKKYLLRQGIPAKLIFEEGHSRETVGNAYRSKLLLLRSPRLANVRRILLVTSLRHGERARWIFERVFGPRYRFSVLGVPSAHVPDDARRRLYERYITGLYRELLSGIAPGDHRAIYARLRCAHPAYSHTKEAKNLLAEIIKQKKRLLGYVRPRIRGG